MCRGLNRDVMVDLRIGMRIALPETRRSMLDARRQELWTGSPANAKIF